MARPRSFSEDLVVEEAKILFWDNGYQNTGIGDLERATGLSRSSLYAAFGTKQALFDHALDSYLDSFIGPRFVPMEREGADSRDIERFFAGLAEHFGSDQQAQRGCLMINSIAEHEGRGDHLAGRAQAFRDRLHDAFVHALAGTSQAALVSERARILTAATFGIWLLSRIDPADAARACDATISQLRTWFESPKA